MLKAYGDTDVVAGVFSVFSEMSVKDGQVKGYLKPLFKDVTAYDPEQDQDKGLLTKIFEKTINVASSVLKITPRGKSRRRPRCPARSRTCRPVPGKWSRPC